MKTMIRLSYIFLILAITPSVASAQRGTTPLILGPIPLGPARSEIGGYVTIEDDIDLFGIYRHGISPGVDFGIRGGYTSAFRGGVNLGGDIRYHVGSPKEGLRVHTSVIGGFQLTLAEDANVIQVPFGASIGAHVGSGRPALLLYGAPYLFVIRRDPEGPRRDTDLEFGLDLGIRVDVTPKLIFDSLLTITSDDDNVSLALGLTVR